MKMRVSTIATLAIAAMAFIGVMWLISMVPVAPTTPTATPMPTLLGRRFDAQMEAYLWALEQTPTGWLLSKYLRESDIKVEWVPSLHDELPGISDTGAIVLSRNRMTMPDGDQMKLAVFGQIPSEEVLHALDVYVADSAVVAHEIAHHVMGDPELALPESGSPERDRAEDRVRIVELKFVCEMIALARRQEVDYYLPDAWETYAESMPPDPTDMEGLLVGAQPDDMSLARTLLAFPARSGQ